MRKTDTHPLFTASAWLLQHLSYRLCRWYFFRLQDWTINASPLMRQVHKPVILATAPHLSHSDVIIVPASIPLRLLPVRWLADRMIFNSRIKTLWYKLWVRSQSIVTHSAPLNPRISGGFSNSRSRVNALASFRNAAWWVVPSGTRTVISWSQL